MYLWSTNITPSNQRLEDEISFWDGLFSGAIYVSFRECIITYHFSNVFPSWTHQLQLVGFSRVGGNWGTLRICREDWGMLGIPVAIRVAEEDRYVPRPDGTPATLSGDLGDWWAPALKTNI